MSKHYSTILVISLALIVLFLLSGNLLFLYIALGLGVMCLLIPWMADKTHWLWMGLSKILAKISSTILFAIVFFIIIAPLAFIARLGGKKFLVLKRDTKSYYTQRNFLYDKESIENVW